MDKSKPWANREYKGFPSYVKEKLNENRKIATVPTDVEKIRDAIKKEKARTA